MTLKSTKVSLLLSLPFLFFSCETDINSNEEISKNEAISPESFQVESNSIRGEIVTIQFFEEQVEVEKINDDYYLEGDIIVTPDEVYNASKHHSNKSVGRTTRRWENNAVYYEIENDLPNQYRVYDAIEHWEENTDVRFYPKTDTTEDYITFRVGTGCSSYVGKIGGQQYINLAYGCSTGNTIHEIGHAVGLWHEQSRKDRDDYLIINFDNITSGYEHNFRTYEERGYDGFEYTDEFDFGSIMMYPPYAFSTNGEPTITTLDGSTSYGYQRSGLSDADIVGIYKMYPALDDVPVIENPSFSIKAAPYDGASDCSCFGWYNENFPKQPGSSTDSNDNAGTEGGGSIKLTYASSSEQRTAYQLIDNVSPGTTYKLTFYYAIKNEGTIGELDFRVLHPNATSPSTVTSANTIAQFTGEQTSNSNSIKASNGGGQIAEVEFTASTNQVALYAVNSVLGGSDVRIDNFSIEIVEVPINIPVIENPTFSIKATPYDGASYTCSCFGWYNSNFPKQPGSSTDSNDDPGTQGGGSIKLNYDSSDAQRTAYQLLDGLTPGAPYRLTFYYAIADEDNPGELLFKILQPAAVSPATVTSANTIASFSGAQASGTNSIKASNGGGRLVEMTFTPSSDQVVLYAVNPILGGSDVRIDNFSIEVAD